MLYVAETWATIKKQENGLRWTRWECYGGYAEWHAKTRSGTNTSEGRTTKVSKKITGDMIDFRTSMGMWWGENEEHILRKVLRTDIPGKRKIERQKTRWKANETWKVFGWERARRRTPDRAMWRRKISSYIGNPTWWGKPVEKNKKNEANHLDETFLCTAGGLCQWLSVTCVTLMTV